jgi:hypothetical protein
MKCFRKPLSQKYVKWTGSNFEEIKQFFGKSDSLQIVFGHCDSAVYGCLNELNNGNFAIYIFNYCTKEVCTVIPGDYIVEYDWAQYSNKPRFVDMSEERFNEEFDIIKAE